MNDKMRLFKGVVFNRRQQKAIMLPLGTHCVVAGAGTGKTRVLVSRIIYLLEKFKLEPANILAITFTKKAAQEIIERVKQYLWTGNFKWIRTIHSFCTLFLGEEIGRIRQNPAFDVVKESVREKFIREVCSENKVDYKSIDPNQLTNALWNQKILDSGLDQTLMHADKTIVQNQKVDETGILLQNVIKWYSQRLVKENKLDFDDLLILTYKILKQFPDVKSKWQDLFKYILVDEFQDLDQIQYEIIKMLAQKSGRLFVVGDPDQSIYAWRGAIPNIEQKLKHDFPKTKILLLKRNYRCSKKILRVANQLIKHNSGRTKKKLFSKVNFKDKVVYYHATGQQNEAEWIVEQITTLLAGEEELNFGDIAIIYRKNFWPALIEVELVKHNLFHICYKDQSFYQRKEIRDMIAYISAVVLKDDDSIYQIINTPTRTIDETSLAIIKAFVKTHVCSLYEALVDHHQITHLTSAAHQGIKQLLDTLKDIENQSHLKFDQIVQKIVLITDYLETANLNDDRRRENLLLLVQAMKNYQQKNPTKTLSDFINEIAPLTSPAKPEKPMPNDVIKLMTIHSAKGLEFPCVFVVGLVDNVFPDWRSISLPNRETNPEALKEERRLLYVALTRAKRHLYLTSCGGNNLKTGLPMKGSRFIEEIIHAGLVRYKH